MLPTVAIHAPRNSAVGTGGAGSFCAAQDAVSSSTVAQIAKRSGMRWARMFGCGMRLCNGALLAVAVRAVASAAATGARW